MRQMDLTDIDLPDSSDDRKALSEFRRVLTPGGYLVLQEPIRGAVSYEDASIDDEQMRLEKSLQEDHVRLYGLDLKARIEASGLACEVLSVCEMPRAEHILYSLDKPYFREVFFCRRLDGA
jgi:SAM-dependent methyltransferase